MTIAGIAFVCMFGGALLGAFLRRFLPSPHLSSDSRDVVKLGAGLIATHPGSAIEEVWPKNRAGAGGMNFIESAKGWEEASDKIRELTPQTESQRLLKMQALQISGELSQLRWLLVEQAHGSMPAVFLVVLLFWFTTLFVTFGLLTPSNGTVMTVMLVCAMSVAGGVLLILEMNQPLTGLIKVSSAPLEKALDHLSR